MSADPSDLIGAYLDHALGGEARQAVELTLGLLDAGVPGETVIAELLATAQQQVGERWHQNELTVADEHLATGAAQSSVHALAGAATDPRGPGRVLVACAEGDWHSLAAHMFSEQLRARDVAVSFLGASTPAEHVARFIQRTRPDALAISCNLPLFYAGLSRLADVAHGHGVPVLAGGRALRGEPERARLVGADAWADSIDDALPILGAWRECRPAVSTEPTYLDPGALELDAVAGDLASAAFDDLYLRFPAMASYDTGQLARTREDLAFIVQFVAAAQLVDDHAVLIAFLDWLTQLLGARGVPKAAVINGLESLQPLLRQASPTAGQLADIGLEHLALAG